MQNVMLPEEVRKNGLGDVDDARMTRAVAQVVEAFGLPRAPAGLRGVQPLVPAPRDDRAPPAP
jgi:hypothetical protein